MSRSAKLLIVLLFVWGAVWCAHYAHQDEDLWALVMAVGTAVAIAAVVAAARWERRQ